MTQIEIINKEIELLREKLLKHKLYSELQAINDLQLFMEYHVFAVWDFMSLLKALQINLTCVTIPWVPKGSAATRRLINEIVLGEETDVDSDGKPSSHFELYVDAMTQINASSEKINTLINYINGGKSLQDSLRDVDISQPIKEFIEYTFSVIKENKPHKIAAAFTFGREDLIPDLFRGLVIDLNNRFAGKLEKMIYYLDRHIEVDDGIHGPLAIQMMEELCGNNAQLWSDCLETSKKALEKRLILWDGIYDAIIKNRINKSVTL